MQRIILFFSLVFLAIGINAQPPQLIPYQAIARGNAGNPVLNQNIGLRFSIHDQTISGAVVWQESQTVVSNNLGIIVTALGGTTQLTSVDWGSGAKFLQVEMDVTGGSNYLDMGTQQMMSVPYALYAETSGSVVNNNGGGGNGSFTHWIGELYGGGIICHLFKDTLGIEHGLIASLNDLTDGFNQIPWGVNNLDIGPTSWFDGASNTDLIYNSGVDANSPIALCHNYSNQGFTDWYLPSISELELVWGNIYILNSVLSTMPNANQFGFNVNYINGNQTQDRYWSSSMVLYGANVQGNVYAMGYYVNDLPNRMLWLSGNYPNNVRAIRKF